MSHWEQAFWERYEAQARARAEERRRQNTPPPPPRGPEHAVRPPWAPPEPPPLERPPALLPGLVDLVEQMGEVVNVVRCPECGVFFSAWVSVTDAQFALGQLSLTGCSCPGPRHYEKQTARKLGLLP